MAQEATGDRVRRYRRLRRLSQAQLAEKAGTDKGYIGQLEVGRIAEPKTDVLVRLAAALEVPVRALADPRLYDGEQSPDALAAAEAAILSEPTLSEDRKQAALVVIRDLFARSREQAG